MDSSFEKSINTKVEWLTPPDLLKKLGEFDLDPCSPINAPFYHAKNNYTIEDNGIGKEVEFIVILLTEEVWIFGSLN